jgi:hypothetical protein
LAMYLQSVYLDVFTNRAHERIRDCFARSAVHCIKSLHMYTPFERSMVLFSLQVLGYPQMLPGSLIAAMGLSGSHIHSPFLFGWVSKLIERFRTGPGSRRGVLYIPRHLQRKNLHIHQFIVFPQE